jgi:hypothetical protein
MVIEDAIKILREHPEATETILDTFQKIWDASTDGDKLLFLNRYVLNVGKKVLAYECTNCHQRFPNLNEIPLICTSCGRILIVKNK